MLAPPIAHVDLRTFGDEKVNLKKDEADKHRAKVRDLRERLDKYIKEHPDCGLVKMLLSGSLAKGTALSKLNDIDVAIYVKEDGAPKAVKDLAEWLAERLRKAYPTIRSDHIVANEFSVTIKFMGAGLDVDIVPVYYAGLPHDKGHLVSRLTGELVLTSIPLHLQFIRKRKNAQTKHFAQVIRLLKWWASELKEADANFRFKSFMIELICADLADRGIDMSDYPQAIETFFNEIVTTGLKNRIAFTDNYPLSELPTNVTEPIQIYDPVNPENNVASRYTDANRIQIVDAAQDALDAINEAHTAATKGHALGLWKEVMGSSFKA